jgi:MFS family permease
MQGELIGARLMGGNTDMSCRPYISSCLLGCWLTDPLNHYLGRRGTIFISGIFCTLSVIGSACAQTWPQLFVSVVVAHLKLADVPTSCNADYPFASWYRDGC